MTQVSEPQSRRTTQVKVINRPPAQTEPMRPPLTLGSDETSWQLQLEIGESGTSVTLELASQIVVGRTDPDDGHVPGLDMGPYGGQDYGVSRKHAALYVEEGRLYIRDLTSTNGTRVNGFALEPDQPQKLAQGDEIEVGQLRFILSRIQASD